jgi:hypothetical protein
MTDRDSDAWRRTEGTTAMRLWAYGMRAMLAGSRELTRAGDETRRATTADGRRRDRPVEGETPDGAVAPAEAATSQADAFDAFLATFEQELPA